MSLKENIITHALLGTEKKQINPAELPESLKLAVESLTGSDNETKFLQSASLALNYLKAGVKPLQLSVPSNESPDEDKPYCTEEALNILRELLSNKFINLTWFWCRQCFEKRQIVRPGLLPEFFEWGVATKKQWAALFSAVIGKRGLWLSQFSADWSFVNAAEEVSEWETSSLSQRIYLLRRLRVQNPSEARDKIASVCKEENAATRQELLETISIGISKEDESFLIQVLGDKSLKVKELAWQLLKLIPDSDVNFKYQQILRESFVITSGKVLGLISKTNIVVKLKLESDEIFKTGIQNLSSDKKINDDDFILTQLISEVPPEFWAEHLACSPEEVIKMFSVRDELKKFQQSLSQAVIKFRNRAWARLVVYSFGTNSILMLPLLDDTEKIRYAENLLKVNSNLAEIVNALKNEEKPIEWNTNFSRQLLSVMAQDPYTYANLFESMAVYLPASVVNDLDKFFPSEEWKRNYWQKTSAQIKEYIRLKEKIKAIF